MGRHGNKARGNKMDTSPTRITESDGINRETFIKGAGAAAFGAGAAILGLGGLSNAQMPPEVPDYYNDEGYGPEYVMKTLAALADTIIPGKAGEQVYIFDPQTQGVFPDPMDKLGAEGEEHPGAAFIPLYGGQGYPPAYFYFFNIFPQIAHNANIVNLLIHTLDKFLEPYEDILPLFGYAGFKDLPYQDTNTNIPGPSGDPIIIPGRYKILYLMDTPAELIPLLVQKYMAEGMGYEQAYQMAVSESAQAKQLAVNSIYIMDYIYYSELCNIVPGGFSPESGMPYYSRNADESWTLFPQGPWKQISYPGPRFKEPSFASEYEGLKITISDGKVKFIQ